MKESQKIINKIQEQTTELENAIERDLETLEDEKEELEDQLDQTIRPKTLEDEMKLKMLKRISEQCTLTQIEVLHQFAINYFPTFNPHI